jgi:hypothetical protein
MRPQLLATLAVGLVVISVAIYSTVSINQKHLLTLTGSITDVRTAELSPEATLVILDFTAQNPSEIAFEVKELAVQRVDGIDGNVLSKAETVRFMEYSQLPQPNAPVGIGDRIAGGQTVKRMIAARFDSPAAGLADAVYRIRFRHIENVDAQIEGRKESEGKP